MSIPGDLRYTASHEWARLESDIITVGITSYAQEALGDVVFAELPEVGATFDAKESFGGVESVKAFSDVYVPVAGEIVKINESLEDQPELVNEDPYGAGWLIQVRVADTTAFESLFDAAAYEAHLHKD